MAPKKKPNSTAGSSRSKPKSSSSTSKRSSLRSIPKLTPDEDVVELSDEEPESSQAKKINTIMNRKNRLGDLFNSQRSQQQQQQQKEEKPKAKSAAKSSAKQKSKPAASAATSKPNTSKPTSRSKRQSRSFEEDEGFKFKRSQEYNKRDQVGTPISKLRQELIGISDEEDAPLSYVTAATKKRKVAPERNRPSDNSFDSDSYDEYKYEDPGDDDSRSDIAYDEGYKGKNVLSSPIRSNGAKGSGSRKRRTTRAAAAPKRYVEEEEDYGSSEEYVEQSSQMKIPMNDSGTSRYTSSNKLKRRSSYNNRGKRLSSIGNGFVGVPHESIPPAGYYKLLDTSLPEPHRMRQLLIWCFKKKLDQEEKQSRRANLDSEDKTSVNIAKVIKEEVLTDLINGEIETSWYNKDEVKETGTEDSIVKLLPNPLNIKTLENIQIYREKLNKLEDEKRSWEKSLDKYGNVNIDRFPSIQLSKNDDEEVIEAKQLENSSDNAKSIVNGDIIKSIENSIVEVEGIPEKVENSIDAISHTAYRLAKGNEVIEELKNKQLNGEISAVVKDCIIGASENAATEKLSGDKDETSEAQPQQRNSGFWPKSRSPTTKELLRGIARLDARQ